MALIDIHPHVVSDDATRFPLSPIGAHQSDWSQQRPVTYDGMIRAMDAAGVAKSAVVQASSVYAYDNRYVGDAAHAHPTRLQFVCQVDAADRDCVQQARDWIARGAVGVRFMEPTKGSDLAWLDGPGARAVWQVSCDEGVPISVHFFPWNRAAGLRSEERRVGKEC